ncbi:uncharacterized protein LOC141911805 [Tubulanus polymorphus]|uniref:uncharacterized protein LOC141911805 n=1 Tax=Tubulanus polymorphus TaxID=672921 RepID=UPI003DA4E338
MLNYQLHGSHCLACGNKSIPLNDVSTWMEMVHLILYWAHPSIIGFGIVTGVVNIVTLARQVQTSVDTYLTGLAVSSTLLQLCGAFLWLPLYIGHYTIYQQLHGYFVSINDWFWYTSLWLILVMSLERVLSLTQNQTRSLCSPIQACVSTVMVYCVCLASSLPRFWEYEVVEYVDAKTNVTVYVSQRSDVASTPEYTIMYFWYLTSITVFLPIPVMIVLTCLLSKVTQSLVSSTKRRQTPRINNDHENRQPLTGPAFSVNPAEETNMTRLYISFIGCYIVFTSPRTFLDLLPNLTVGIVDTDSSFYHTLHDLFQVLFYLNFSIQFLLFLSYYKHFRRTLKSMCCCCCCCGCSEDEDEIRNKNNPYI